MPRAAFAALGTYVPDRVVTNEELTQRMETTDAWIQERTGIRERRWVARGDARTRTSRSRRRSRRSTKAGWQAEGHRGDHLRLALARSHVPGRRLLPQREARHPGRPRARRPQPVLRVPLRPLRRGRLDPRPACTGASSLVGSEIHSTGLDVSTRGRDVAVIFGDGAGAALLEATDDPGRGVLSVPPPRRRPLRRGALDCDAPGVEVPPARPGRDDRVAARSTRRWRGRRSSSTRSRRCRRWCARRSTKNGLTPKDLKLLVPHQANLRISQMVQRSLELRDDQVFNNIQQYGNTTAASIPHRARRGGRGARRPARGPRRALRVRGRLYLGERPGTLVEP